MIFWNTLKRLRTKKIKFGRLKYDNTKWCISSFRKLNDWLIYSLADSLVVLTVESQIVSK